RRPVRCSRYFAPIATTSHGSSGGRWRRWRRRYTVGRSERRKGVEAEREFARLIGGERVPLSGAAGGSYTGDVIGLGLRWECKRRKDGFKQLYDWLEGKDALAVRADRKPWLVVMRLETLLEIAGAKEESA